MKNRTVMAPMTGSSSPHGVATAEVAGYYARGAQGEVGVIITEATVVDRPSSHNDPNAPAFRGDAALAGWKARSAAELELELERWLGRLAEPGDVFHCSQRRFWEPEFEASDLNLAGWA